MCPRGCYGFEPNVDRGCADRQRVAGIQIGGPVFATQGCYAQDEATCTIERVGFDESLRAVFRKLIEGARLGSRFPGRANFYGARGRAVWSIKYGQLAFTIAETISGGTEFPIFAV